MPKFLDTNMAIFIPVFNQLDKHLQNQAELRVARFLNKYLSDDCLVWCNIPIGKKHLYADFLILIPDVGLLCLEVKDWKLNTVRHLNKQNCHLEIDGSTVKIQHPLEQARTYAHNAINTLMRDETLLQQTGKHQGKLILPYAYGVVFTHFERANIHQKLNGDVAAFDAIFPMRYTLYKNDLNHITSKQALSYRLNGMFTQKFNCALNQQQIDRIRWHLFPEIRINIPVQHQLFDEDTYDTDDTFRQPESLSKQEIKLITHIPQMIKVMDIQQETTARMMGGGHRVIHGVAGSGKTLILSLRAQVLAERTEKPILILCYNITLAAKLRALMKDKGFSEKIQIHHFHEWCGKLVKQFNITYTQEEQQLKHYDKPVKAALRAAENGLLPLEQYGAILIDEGHDFEADWLRLAVKMLDKSEDHLLLLYDDVQSIYPNQRNQKGIPFTLSSVGIQARGRTVKLANNYRNTKQIIGLAHIFAQQYLQTQEQDEDKICVVEPCAVGADGDAPQFRSFTNWQEEKTFLIRCLKKWQEKQVPLQEIAIICPNQNKRDELAAILNNMNLPYWALDKRNQRTQYDPTQSKITLIPIQSSKGLEFQRVILAAADEVIHQRRNGYDPIRLIYVAMTRAQSQLLITFSSSNEISEHIQHSFTQWQAFQAA